MGSVGRAPGRALGSPSPAHGLAQPCRNPPSTDRLGAGGAGWARSHQVTQAVWRTVGPDLLDLASGERDRLAREFGAWLSLLQDPCTLVICSRLWAECKAPPEGSALDRARVEGMALDRADRGAYRRTTHLVTDGVDESLDQALLMSMRRHCLVESERTDQIPPLAVGPLQEQARQLLIGGRHLHSLRLCRLPTVEVGPGWLWSLLCGAGEFDLAITIAPRDPALADRDLRLRLRGLRARELAGSRDSPDPRISVLARAAEGLRFVLAEGEERLFEVAMTITLAANSWTELEAVTRDFWARSAGLRSGWTSARFDEFPARLESLGRPQPGLRPKMLVSTGEVSTLWPWFGQPHLQAVDRSLVGTHKRTGQWLGLDLHRDPGLTNANLAVVASSGAGKSYLAGLLAMEAVRRGQAVVVVDPENEHAVWCEHAGGTYMDVLSPGAARFNVLEMGPSVEALAATADLVGLLCGPLATAERSALLEVAGALIEEIPKRRLPVLADCLPLLQAHPNGRDLATRLRPWVSGESGQFFSSPGRGPEVRGVLALGIRGLPEPWIRPATLLISSWLWQWVKDHPGEKQVIVDEAGLLADSPALQQLMERLARRVRKYQGSLMLLTQTGADLTATRFGEVMVVNSATQLLGSQSEAGARRLQDSLALDEPDRLFLQQAARGEFLLVCGLQRIPLTVAAPPIYHSWLTRATSQPAGRRTGAA